MPVQEINYSQKVSVPCCRGDFSSLQVNFPPGISFLQDLQKCSSELFLILLTGALHHTYTIVRSSNVLHFFGSWVCLSHWDVFGTTPSSILGDFGKNRDMSSTPPTSPPPIGFLSCGRSGCGADSEGVHTFLTYMPVSSKFQNHIL